MKRKLLHVRSGPNAYNPDAMMGPTVQSSKPRAPRYTISSRSSHGGYLADNGQPVRSTKYCHCSLRN